MISPPQRTLGARAKCNSAAPAVIEHDQRSDVDLESVLKPGKSLKLLPTSPSKWYQILEKSASGANLEDFERALGAKRPQERHEEQILK